ncbi:methylated-DNA-[protein]-cysteine S-methyltransferase [Methylobacillus rhizosphaerae]|uniref:Methylated-DNA-[protein]-cysteine S-methyltransferase n=1 Tax=Methylobacillus rhizosphaerae TaxID=551994 RepID=A0A238XUW8_9PROT|nr:methylated-DNA--[protein]-cysteine S-methyltransferase [Methylobacillus rhizosphaerae]SNR62856.1 methylated-DNA-[protein]-cysteine S-methyltransferase [Methylobacillus rhizosphaerae]
MSSHHASEFDAVITAPFGAIGINVADEYVTGMRLISSPLSPHCPAQPFAQYVALQIQQYLDNTDHVLDVPYIMQGTPFQKRVWRAMMEIPLGQVWTYSELATRVASGPRAVANVCGANHLPLLIPCHRIVAKSGIGGFMKNDKHGLDVKRWLLQHEHVNAYS